jgi:hypothetical protein
MEPRFGHDFSQVRIHTGPEAAASADSVSALAYTVGRDIVFGKGDHAFGTRRGSELIAHELAHVVQQGGRTASRPNDLILTHPGDTTEREADAAAVAVTGGAAFRPQARNGVALARKLDAGAPFDAAASSAPREAAPIAAVPEPGLLPPLPTPQRERQAVPVAPPTATIGSLMFRGSANRIAPTQAVTVPVIVSGLRTGGTVKIDVEGSGGANGTAAITAGATLTGSGTVTVRGDTQTMPGNAGSLRLRATVGGEVVGRSPSFTVAAWPTDFSIYDPADADNPLLVGLRVKNAFVSDGSGSPSELGMVEQMERVDIDRRDNPPFKTEGPTSATGGTTDVGIVASSSPIVDTHTYSRADIDTTGVAAGKYTVVYRQNFLFNDFRTGTTKAVIPKSGFTITHTVWVEKVGPFARRRIHQTEKRGAAVSVEGKAATAGSGTATSQYHILEEK